MKSIHRIKQTIILFSLILLFGFMTHVQAVTDAELEALEQQLEQQEEEAKRKAEEIRKTELKKKRQLELELKKKEEERQRQEIEAQKIREQEKQQTLANERKRLEEEQKKKADKEKDDQFNKYIRLAESHMANDEFEKAIAEYDKALVIFPNETKATMGINEARKFLQACNDIVGKWFLEPNGITWLVHQDKTVFGTWLIFSSNGFWECVNARKREVVVSWPDCGVCLTEYLYLSEDGKTMRSSRGTATHGRKVDEASHINN